MQGKGNLIATEYAMNDRQLDDEQKALIIKGAWNVNKRTIVFESVIETGAVGREKELEDHLEEIRRLIMGLKINTVTIKTSVEIK